MPDDDGPTTGAALERHLSALLRWGTRSDVQQTLWLHRSDLSATDDWLLRRVIDVGPVRVSELAAWQRVESSTITTQVRRLERADLVERVVDPHDGRAALVQVTASGRRSRDRNSSRAAAVLDALLADWSARERADLVRLLNRLVGSLDGPVG